jgi:hypothetical protein
LRIVQADSGQVPEQGSELGPIGFWQRRLEQGRHIAAQVVAVAGAEQHHVNARFVPCVTVGGVD